MAWLPLGEAVDRVLARLADQREGKTGEVVNLPGKEAPAEGLAIRAREKPGCDGLVERPFALRQRGSPARVAGRPGGRRE